MRAIATAPLIFTVFLACNGTTTSTRPSMPGMNTGGNGDDTPPATDAAAKSHDAASAPPDAAPVTVDAPVVVTPSGPGPDSTVMAFSGTEVSFVTGPGNNKRIVDAPVKFP